MKNKLLIIIPTIIFGLLGIVYKINYDTQENENIKIDEYNFNQFYKIQNLLSGQNKDLYKFNNLRDFNKFYISNIKPIQNCYILSNVENFFGKSDYMFMSKIYSQKFKNIYKHEYYIYPENKYDLIDASLCGKHGGTCTADLVFSEYITTIIYKDKIKSIFTKRQIVKIQKQL